MAEQRITFQSEGLTLSGAVRVPEGIRPSEGRPAFIVLHGFGSNMNAGNVLGPCAIFEKLGYVTMHLAPSPAQQADLEKLLEEQRDPASPNYHKWLMPEQFAGRFGVSQSDIAKIAQWLESEGLKVESQARGRNWMKPRYGVVRPIV